MAGINLGNLSWSISHMLDQNSAQINTAIVKQNSMKSWLIIAAVIAAVILIVKRMGK